MDGTMPLEMKICKFQIHTVTMGRTGAPGEEAKGGDELRLASRDFLDLKDGDVVEIYHVEDEFSRLLLQVKNTSFRADLGHNTISVEDSIAKTFQLRAYQNVILNPVPFKDVELNLLELTLKDQYFSRSDMWRNRNALVGSCAHLHKKLEYGCGRTAVHEMWAKGGRVACGTIGENTKIVYRSMTANVYIFIQMSVEMWEFDHYGDLYFEKSIKGFLTDLFKKWQKQQANHDVTIVMFSRTFYDADSLEEFPCKMREGLLRDYKDRFYEDFYQIVVQNEKYDDWTFALIKLKTIFHSYNETVLNFHNHSGVKLPRAYNSTASEGNVLEVLNMGLNVFEKHTVDRSFERTGQMCVVITPSTGVFEVDRELLTLTKQKSIDYGIGNDLVFMGEQPLHVVPLFILHNKRNWKKSGLEEPVDYAIPNWLNYSYYTSKDADPHVFVPRIRIPEKILAAIQNNTQIVPEPATRRKLDSNASLVNRRPNSRALQTTGKRGANLPRTERRLSESSAKPANFASSFLLSEPRTPISSGLEANHASFLLSSSLETANPLRPNAGKFFERASVEQPLSDHQRKSAKSPNTRHQRSLINPLAPSKIPVKLTSNRRRWVDIFPTDTSGAAVQTHHFRGASHSEDAQNTLSKSPASDGARDTESPSLRTRPMDDGDRVPSWVKDGDGDDGSTIEEEVGGSEAAVKSPRRIKSTRAASDIRGSPALSSGIWGNQIKKNIGTKKSYVWGITGEMEWSPNLTTGVDWKALTIPASLPITTDYLPDRRTLTHDYLVSDYSVLPEEPDMNPINHAQGDGQESSRYYTRPLGLRELYEELTCQRLQQGFQLITGKQNFTLDVDFRVSEKISRKSHLTSQSEVCFLSLGRVIHRITMDLSNITVTRYTPRHAYRIPVINYKYRFKVPDMERYEVSWVSFSHERFEEFNWNYLDFCILTKGRGEFKLEHPQMKCWKGQYFVLPCSQSIIKKIMEDQSLPRCDIWTLHDRSPEEYDALCDGFMRVIEMCNRMKRGVQKGRKPNASKRNPTASKLVSLVGRQTHLNAVSSPDLQGSLSSPTRNSGHSSQYTSLDAFKAASNSLGLEVPSPQGSPLTSGLSVMSSLQDVLAGMKSPSENIVTFQKLTDLQTGFFLSYEAVDWAMDTLGIPCSELAAELFSRMITERLIVHASGKPSFPFVSGFYLYNIAQPGETRHPIQMELEDCDIDFDQVWIECAIANPTKGRLRLLTDRARELDLLKEDSHGFTQTEVTQDRNNPYPFSTKKSCVINVDMYYKGSNRLEWAVANYHSTFTPNCAFEIELKWLQASGPMFGELMQVWGRRCPNNGFHLIPVPGDPFALPSKASSDPLRMPIFVPLQCVGVTASIGSSPEVEDGQNVQAYQKIVRFQELILHRFGFISLQENARRLDVKTCPREYVHVSGGMFCMIPAHDNSKELEELRQSSTEQLSDDCRQPVISPLTGYWWAWNNCLTKKWRSLNTGDEAFLDKMLADFRRFCSNDDNRLEKFWSEYIAEVSVL